MSAENHHSLTVTDSAVCTELVMCQADLGRIKSMEKGVKFQAEDKKAKIVVN